MLETNVPLDLCFARTGSDRSDGEFPALDAWRTDDIDRFASHARFLCLLYLYIYIPP